MLRQPAYALVNGSFSARTSDEVWEVRVGVKNLFDQAVRRQGFNLSAFPGVQVAFYDAPRTFDVRLRRRF